MNGMFKDLLKSMNGVGGDNSKMMKEMESMWKTLDDLAESDPTKYADFIKQTQSSFVEQEGFQPTPHYVVEVSFHFPAILNDKMPGDWYQDTALNFTSSDRVKVQTDSSKAPQFSLGSRHEREIKGKKKAYYDVVFNPGEVPLLPKPENDAALLQNIAIRSVLVDVLIEETRRAGKQLLPGGPPKLVSGKYVGDTKVRTHIIGQLRGGQPKEYFDTPNGNKGTQSAVKSVSTMRPDEQTPKDSTQMSATTNDTLKGSSLIVDISDTRPTPASSANNQKPSLPVQPTTTSSKPPARLVEDIIFPIGSKPAQSAGDFTETATRRFTNIVSPSLKEQEEEKKPEKKVQPLERVLLPGRSLMTDEEFASNKQQIESENKRKEDEEMDKSSVSLFAATNLKPRRGFFIQEIDPVTKE